MVHEVAVLRGQSLEFFLTLSDHPAHRHRPHRRRRDIHGGVNTTITVTHIFEALASAVSEAEEIPEEEKPSLLEKIKALATNPFILGIGPPLIVEALKSQLGLSQK